MIDIMWFILGGVCGAATLYAIRLWREADAEDAEDATKIKPSLPPLDNPPSFEDRDASIAFWLARRNEYREYDSS